MAEENKNKVEELSSDLLGNIGLDNIDIDTTDIDVDALSGLEESDALSEIDIDVDIPLGDDLMDMDSMFKGTEEVKPSTDSNDIFDDIFRKARESVVQTDEDIFSTSRFSDATLEFETKEFIKDLKITLELLANPASDIIEKKQRNIISKSLASKYNKEISVMKDVFDAIKKYHETNNRDCLPAKLAEEVGLHEDLQFNDNTERVWREFKRQWINLNRNNQQALNEFSDNMSKLKEIFSSYADYFQMDERASRDTKARMDRTKKIRDKKYGYYNTVINRLENGERVTLCNHLTFYPDNNINYKFVCGTCGELAEGVKTVTNTEGKTFNEPEAHSFYQVLTAGGHSLFYPLMCECCGSINVLSKSSRSMMRERIKLKPTADSRDIKEYVIENETTRGTFASDKRPISKDKWKDLLDVKLATEERLAAIDDEVANGLINEEEMLDALFYIDEEEAVINEEDIIADLSDDDYKAAIEAFRKQNTIIDIKSDYDVNGCDDYKLHIAILSDIGSTPMLSAMPEAIASYIINKENFKKLSSLNNVVKAYYDDYLTIHSAVKAMTNGERLEEATVEDFKERFNNLEFNLGKLVSAETEYYNRYESALREYKEFRQLMYEHPSIFGVRRKDINAGALQQLVKAFDYDPYLPEYFNKLITEAINQILLSDILSSFRAKVNGSRVTADSVKGLSSIHDKVHLVENKWNTVIEYAKRVGKGFGVDVTNIVNIIGNFHIDYVKHTNVEELMNSFNISAGTKISEYANNTSFRNMFKTNIEPYFKSFEQMGDVEIGSMLTDFRSAPYLSAFFGFEDITNEDMLEGAMDIFNNVYLRLPNFGIYDVLFNRLIIQAIGFQKFIGMENIDVARALNMSNGDALRRYEKSMDVIYREISDATIFVDECEQLALRKYFYCRNNEGATNALMKVVNNDGEEDLTADEVMAEVKDTLDRIFVEIGEAQNLVNEYRIFKEQLN